MRAILEAGGALLTGLFLFVGCRSAPESIPHVAGLEAYHYDVSIDVNPEEETITGRTLVFLADAERRSSLQAWFTGLAVDSIFAAGHHVPFERSGTNLLLEIPEPGDSLALAFYYSGRPATGLYFAGAGGKKYVYTDSWPERMTGWLPVFSHPAAGVTARLSVAVPQGYQVAASGRREAARDTSGTTVFAYDLTARAPLFSIAFAAGPFRTDTSGTFQNQPTWSFIAQDRPGPAPTAAPDALAFFSEWLGPYPYESYGEVFLPMHHLGMENAGMSFLRSTLLDDRYINFFERLEAVQVHEVAHQWFGNSLRPADWWDLWISEGFATYLTLLYFEEKYGRAASRKGLLELSRRAADARARRPVVMPGRADPEEHLSWVTYRKGASLLHLIRLRLGAENFRAAISSLYARFSDSNASTEDVTSYLNGITGEDLSPLFSFWLYGERLPVLRTNWNAESRTLTWQIENDEATLRGVPFELQLSQAGRIRFVSAMEESVILADWGDQKPEIIPVGVFLDVR